MIAMIKDRYRQLEEWIDGLSTRERGVIFAGLMIGLLALSVSFVFTPLHKKQVLLEQEFRSKREQVMILETKIKALIEASKKDPDKENAMRLEQLKKTLGRLDASLAKVTTELVSPREMARLVERVLRRNPHLQVVKVQSLPLSPLVDEEQPVDGGEVEQTPSAAPDHLIYKHGIYIEVTGRYMDLLQYLRKLESMPWKVFWGRVELASERYPTSRLSLVIYTLSLHEGWIGV